ncbi:RTTN.2 family protein [Megaselia abdita]
MATINIKDFILKKLVNPSQEIRVRSLLMIRDKLIRASNSGLEFDFNFALLVRNLFEWFKVKPLSNEKNALDVMILLFKVRNNNIFEIGYFYIRISEGGNSLPPD